MMKSCKSKCPARSLSFVLASVLSLAVGPLMAAQPAAKLTVSVDPTTVIGPIKPMNAVNNGPAVRSASDMKRSNAREFAAAHIPYARTHDSLNCVPGGPYCVDVSAIFRDFDADENDPQSYDFEATDAYVEAIVEAGTEVFYRLGETIENGTRRKKRTNPPKDFAKWARVAEHIVRHYNEGWGWRPNKLNPVDPKWSPKMKMTFWELYNEPDLGRGGFRGEAGLKESVPNSPSWTGTTAQYYDFFETVARHLKKCFPDIKFGGPASCSATRWSKEFLVEMHRRGVPVDFFSWHYYDVEPYKIADACNAVRKYVDEAGYVGIPSVLNEWNYVKGWGDDLGYSCRVISGDLQMKGAAFVAGTMIACQDAALDLLMYYDARLNCVFNGLFDSVNDTPMKGYYPFYAWGKLASLGTEVKTSLSLPKGFYAVTAKGSDGALAVYVVRYQDAETTDTSTVTLKIPGYDLAKAITHVTDRERSHTEVPLDTATGDTATFRMAEHSLVLVEVPASARKPVRVVLTFDDALKDHLLIAAPELEKRGWRGTFNIVTDWIGKDEKYLTWDDVRELVRRGHEVTTHTVGHPNLVQLLKEGNTNEVRRQLAVSRDLIAERTGFVPRYLCTPGVAQNEATDRLCREAGLRQMNVPRHNFGANNADAVCEVVSDAVARGCRRLDLLHHGVSAADHGGWCPFPDRASFARHLSRIAEMERQGVLRVTDYDGCASSCELKAAAWPRHGVIALSFDDHNLADWERAFPLFEKYGATATFCISGEIDEKVVSFARQALWGGHEVALHGLRHRNADAALAEMGEEAYWKAEMEPQIDACRAANVPVRSFAYPNCQHDAASDALFARHGFTRLRGSIPDERNPNPYDPKNVKRDQWRPVATADAFFVPAVDYLTERNISNVILGESYHTDIDDILRAVSRAGLRGERLSLVSHGISPDAKGISMKTEWLDRILAVAQTSGVVVRGLR